MFRTVGCFQIMLNCLLQVGIRYIQVHIVRKAQYQPYLPTLRRYRMPRMAEEQLWTGYNIYMDGHNLTPKFVFNRTN